MRHRLSSVIACAYHISGLSDSDARAALVDLLASNPTIILNHFNKTAKSLIDREQTPEKLFKVVITEAGCNRINLIKFVRGLLNLGLADAKGWTEGVAPMYNSTCPLPGVLGERLHLLQAETLIKQAYDCGSGFSFNIMDNDAKYVSPLRCP
jgi:hypothetical protein